MKEPKQEKREYHFVSDKVSSYLYHRLENN